MVISNRVDIQDHLKYARVANLLRSCLLSYAAGAWFARLRIQEPGHLVRVKGFVIEDFGPAFCSWRIRSVAFEV